jgi:hypothetical protein
MHVSDTRVQQRRTRDVAQKDCKLLGAVKAYIHCLRAVSRRVKPKEALSFKQPSEHSQHTCRWKTSVASGPVRLTVWSPSQTAMR